MRTVFKYEVPIADETLVTLPSGAEIIHIDEQYGKIALWAIVDRDESTTVDRTLYVRGTGHPFTGEEGEHVATVLAAHGQLVWHIFEAAS